MTYYLDTGQCVFCDADDMLKKPHSYCDVGRVAQVTEAKEATVPPRRRQRKAQVPEYMTKLHALTVFKDSVLPQMGIADRDAKARAWVDYTGALQKDGYISGKQFKSWSNPF